MQSHINFTEVTHITAHTDGSCGGCHGGWGVVISYHKGDELLHSKDISDGEVWSTNQRMELSAAIGALKVIYIHDNLPAATPVTIISDSEYLVKGMTEWLCNWKRNNWFNSAKKPVKNPDLWHELDKLAAGRDLTWQWVRGHSGNALNERADALAANARNKFNEDFINDKIAM